MSEVLSPPEASSPSVSDSNLPPVERLRELAALKDEGIISHEDFEAKKKELLNQM